MAKVVEKAWKSGENNLGIIYMYIYNIASYFNNLV